MTVWNGVDGGSIPEYERIGRDMFKTYYVCEFYMGEAYMHVEGNSLHRFINGFWVNDKYELTIGSDAKYWMPPSCIVRVSKERKILH